MNIWHLTPDAKRIPRRVSAADEVILQIGTWPIEPGQSVWVEFQIVHPDGESVSGSATADWQRNEGANSYWQASLGSFAEDLQVNYTVHGKSAEGEKTGETYSFRVGPKLYLALLWHQHQPLYKDNAHPSQAGSYLYPWVRLHAIRDYYSMAYLLTEHPGLHLTINLTPSLVMQIEDYIDRGATDRALELSLKPAEELGPEEQKYLSENFFDADWHHQIFPHARYYELYLQQREGRSFSVQELRDLQMWFNLAWFGKEFRDEYVRLVTGEIASVKRFVEQERGYSLADIKAMVEEQYKIMRAVIPIHRRLQEEGQLEISTTPYFHPILPLLVDTDRATIDRPGTSHPIRFAHPEDAEAQVSLAVQWYKNSFGREPRGMWPAEGAVSQSIIPIFARRNVRWIATDRGVLARSGKWGYQADAPDVLCRPYLASEGDSSVSVFFRDTQLSDSIGFFYQGYDDDQEAARDFLGRIKERFAHQLETNEDRVLTIILDGENAWGAYREDARPFLHALYNLLERDAEIRTVTFSEYLSGEPARSILPHPPAEQTRVFDLFTGSWIDEIASAPGVDLGTWIGEEEENRAWDLLRQARDLLNHKGLTKETAPAAFQSLYTAEGSDWFWWYGDDQDSGKDEKFDDLFRLHLKNIYGSVGERPPAILDRHIVPHSIVWTHVTPVDRIQTGDRLTVRTNSPARLIWIVGDRAAEQTELQPVSGVMAGVHRYQITLGPFEEKEGEINFTFACTQEDCSGDLICCERRPYRVRIEPR